MFGGYGIYSDSSFFGLIHGEQLYFRTDAQTQKRYVEHGTTFFIAPGSKKPLKKYFEVPLHVIEDKKELIEWALEAIGTVPND